MVDERLVRAWWQPPCSRADVAKRESGDDYGIYQVYGHHVVFGPGSLLYVGMAEAQTFAARFAQHAVWLDSESDVVIRLGRIEPKDFKGQKDWAKVLKDVEALTIYWHSPPYNSKNIVRYNGAALRVQNWGDRGRLLPEYSNHWKPSRPEDDE